MYAKYVLFYLERPSSHEPVLNRDVNSYSIEMLGYTLNVLVCTVNKLFF